MILFQVIKNQKKNQCEPTLSFQIYANQILTDVTPLEGKTWRYHPFLKNGLFEYANLYCRGKTLEEACPDFLKEEWNYKSGRLKAFHRACVEARINLNEHCFYDFLPQKILIEYLELKNKISDYIFDTYEKPPNYDFLLELTKVVEDIKEKKLNIDPSFLKNRFAEYKVRQFYKKISKTSPHISYNIFGTKTGRLTTHKGSFPILTMDKSYRSVIKPQNDFFVELDFNAAELRTLLALSGKEQPQEDLHEWNAKNVYRGLQDREESKKRIFAWLYNPSSKDYLSGRAYNRDEVMAKHWNGTSVVTPLGRKIEADEHHALNYIVQSTTSDLFLDRMIAVHKFLANKKSFISFSIHDSLVIDFAESERNLISEVGQIFSQTIFSDFLTNIREGQNYGDMKEICKI